jgi:hypothetical protein
MAMAFQRLMFSMRCSSLDVAGIGRLLLQRDRVAIGRVERGVLDDDIGIGQVVAHRPEQGLGPLRAFGV